MRKIEFLSLIFIPLFLFTVANQVETFFRAEVDKTSLTTDEALTYKLAVTSSAKIIPQPKLPAFEGFSVLSNAQTSQVSISQGIQKITANYVFVLVPADTGKFKIGPSEIEIEGKRYSSDAFEIEVKQGKARTKGEKPGLKSPLPQKSQPETDSPQFTI
ncbi:MAG: BatD family protein [Candidatus Omnitrophica bacterium]|nr:BatD family protein [Candidatus Omnitrophota bacterium]MDD5592820.1 BatD family protein [Candidatus Omnitrophota bacterium]